MRPVVIQRVENGAIAVAVLAGSWAFHIGVDRALGYGLKLPDAFTHTHLGWIGKDRPQRKAAGEGLD